MTNSNDLTVHFYSEEGRDITYHHNDEGMYFEVEGYPDGADRINVSDSETMNFFMGLLGRAGYQSLTLV